jgi:hypothetical protein
MIGAQQSRAYSNDCVTLGQAPAISIQRATILMAMSRSWTGLANQRDRYDAITKEEGK